MHVRKSIRAAVKAALTGLATTGANVFAGRVYPLEDLELPGLLVFLDDEDDTPQTLGRNRTLERTVPLVVEALFKTLASLDDKADDILEEIEVALGAPGVDLGGAKSLTPTKIEFERDGDGEKPAGLMRITFTVIYYTALGAPSTAL